MLDTGHSIWGGEDATSFFERLGARVIHVHLHDSPIDKEGAHIALGEGKLDVMRFLKSAKDYKGAFILEMKSEADIRKSVAYLKQAGIIN
ncbi:MAG: sugar phosphate isomerase/epimerase [archaeon]